MQEWYISENNMTYEVDVSSFTNGVYVLNLVGDSGQVISSEKFVKE